ncbi:hypothetical protein QQS21_001341 [Conoideocrella luteorostrata]|uniref:Uncharacterized protein n=1 Tax=Conoideocrella luteorostrata TaxID=1105319 RepID=A0AAJ0G1W8_9HYPO|nr:hypothetical protein QQS21_001341 [Conoideocrella luteorostrata]
MLLSISGLATLSLIQHLQHTLSRQCSPTEYFLGGVSSLAQRALQSAGFGFAAFSIHDYLLNFELLEAAIKAVVIVDHQLMTSRCYRGPNQTEAHRGEYTELG